MSNKRNELFNKIFNVTALSLLGLSIIVFGELYLNTFSNGFFYENKLLLTILLISVASLITIFAIIFFYLSKNVVYKLLFITSVLLFAFVLLFYILKISGFLDKIDSIDDLRDYVSSFGNFAVIIFVLLQFLQVVLLPIPSFITVGAGVLLFGPFKCAIFSCVGIILGSIVGFFIGKIFGYRVAKWLVGEKELKRGLQIVKGKDKVVLTFMFLFPLFPDDVLCFVAGITTINPTFFIVMIFITRIISIFTSCYSLNNSIIPYNTWWGILIWCVLFAIAFIAMYYIYKNGEKLEKIFKRKKSKKQH